jgi:hypothetical protein
MVSIYFDVVYAHMTRLLVELEDYALSVIRLRLHFSQH